MAVYGLRAHGHGESAGDGVRSLMPENRVIFSDGIEADRLDFAPVLTQEREESAR